MFEMPIMLAGLSAALIPIIIHLLHRQKTTPIEWGAMMFLASSKISRKSRSRIDNWLLMLIRIAILTLLALMLAAPVVPKSHLSPISQNNPSDVVVVLDHSISSGFLDGDQTIFQRGVTMIQQIAATLRPSDSLSVVLADNHPLALTALPVRASDQQAIQDTILKPLREMDSGLTGSSIPEALALARQIVESGDNYQKIIFIISNHRNVSWQAQNLDLWKQALGGAKAPDNLAIFDLPVPYTQTASDIAVGPLDVEPQLPGVGRLVRIQAPVSNSGPLAVPTVPLQLTVDGAISDQQNLSDLASGQTQNIVFNTTFSTAGSHWVKVTANINDALAADNWSLAAVDVWQSMPVLIIDSRLTRSGPLAASEFLSAALSPDPELSRTMGLAVPTVLSIDEAADASLDGYDAVIVNDPPALSMDMLNRLYAFTRSGRGVWFIFGGHTSAAFINHDLPQAGFPLCRTTGVRYITNNAAAPALVIRDPNSPLLTPLAALDRNEIVGVTLTHWWTLQPADATTDVVLASGSGDPLLLAASVGDAGGNVVYSATSMDGQWNDWQTQGGSFVPLVNQIVYQLAMSRQLLANRHYLKPGDPIVWTGPSQPVIQSALIQDPRGAANPVQPQYTPDNRYLLTWGQTDVPGLYQLTFKPDAVPQPVFYSVAIDASQLDPTEVSSEQLAQLQSAGFIRKQLLAPQIPSAVGNASQDMPLWPLLACLILVMLLAEALWCLKLGFDQRRSRADADVAVAA
jgi:Aerotolerance regulator N-terminal/CARDB/von Willebrand factor type A domain